MFLLAFFDSHAKINLLGEIKWIVTWLIIIGEVVLRLQGLSIYDLKPVRCVIFSNKSIVIVNLTEERENPVPSVRQNIQKNILPDGIAS